ncbi:MAG TPA: hypothetical protein VN836_00900 [Verrucomicrobiae bacterium]|nr:hypothetical protein [Verrucomicrobiae bacterium]
MTFVELLPFFIAVGVAVVSGLVLTKQTGFSGVTAGIIALTFGIIAFVSYRPALGKLCSWLERKRTKQEKQERATRIYQHFDPANGYPVGNDLYYECLTCGNVIPSTSKKNVRCACRNVAIDAAAGRLTVQSNEKIKLFSHS